MMKRLVALAAVVVLGLGVALAEEYKGKVKSVDVENNKFVVTVDDKDQTITATKDTEYYTQKRAKKGQPGQKVPVEGGIKGLKEGQNVTVTTEKKDGKETATSVKVERQRKKKNNE